MVEWFKNGLRFGCTECGKCCTGSPGYVDLTDEDIERLSAKLSLSRDAFLHRYTRKIGDTYSLLETRPHYDCIFLEKGLACTVYDARPKQCRTFPFWKEVIESKETWEETGRTCEGIDNPEGKLYSEAEILSFFQ